MITICLRCGHTSDNLDTHDQHQAAAGHQSWDHQVQLLPRPLRAECPSCGAQPGTPCLTVRGREVGQLSESHVARWKVCHA